MAKKPDPQDKIINALMTILETDGWDAVGMGRIAREAGISLAELRLHFANRHQILDAFMARVDGQVLAGLDSADEGETHRDRLFDVMMRRFDALAPHKAALRKLARAAIRDPLLALGRGPKMLRSMRWMLEAAGINGSGPMGGLRARGLMAIYANLMRIWFTDDSADQSKTMAALDRALDRAEGVEKRWCGLTGKLRRFDRRAEPA